MMAIKAKRDEARGTGSRQVLAVVTPYEPAISETFIRAHLESLPAKTLLIHGLPPQIGKAPILGFLERTAHRLWRSFSHGGPGRETTAAYVRALRRHGAHAVLAEYGTTGALVMDACRQLKLPLIVHFHGYDASVHEVLAKNAENYTKMFKEAAAIIAVSRAMQRKLIALGAPADKVHYNPYGVESTKFDGAEPAKAQCILLAVGRFVEKKAPQITLGAFRTAYRRFPQARLRMIGDGPLLDECRKLAKSAGIAEAVDFLGAQPHAVVQAEMRRARAFVQHSIQAANGDSEGTPVGIIEAGASGLPVVSTRHAGIPDVVVDGETGLLVEEGDTEEMAAGMIRLLGDPELAGRLGRAARERIQSHFSKERSDDCLWRIIQSCIESNSGIISATALQACVTR